MDDALVARLQQQIVESLGLEDIQPHEIDPAAPLFVEGLGLDSLDALELVVMVERHYGIKLEDMETSREAFASVQALAEFVTAHAPEP